MMIWVIGDINGQIDPLRNLLWELKRVEYESPRGWRATIAEPVEKLIFIGDYIDRGPSSKEVVDLIESLEYEKVLLMGNHEDMALRFIRQDRGFFEGNGNAWFYNGGLRTWASMAEKPDVPELARFVDGLGYEWPHRWPENLQFELTGDIKEDYRKFYSYKGFELPERYVGFFSKLKYHHRETLEIGRGGGSVNFDFFHGLPNLDLTLAEQMVEGYDDHERLLLKIAASRQEPPVVLGVDAEADARLWLSKGRYADRTALWGLEYDVARGYQGSVVIHGHASTTCYCDKLRWIFIDHRFERALDRQFQTFPRKERLPFLFSRDFKAAWVPPPWSYIGPQEIHFKTGGDFGVEAINVNTGAAYGHALTALGLSSRHLGEGRLIVLTADLDGNARQGQAVRTRFLRFDKLGAPAGSPDW
jgi:hypothetical protein